MEKEERVIEWVEEKKEEGISPDRLKRILEETGRDPELVDKAEDPFLSANIEESDEELEEELDAFDSEGAEDSGEHEERNGSRGSVDEQVQERNETHLFDTSIAPHPSVDAVMAILGLILVGLGLHLIF